MYPCSLSNAYIDFSSGFEWNMKHYECRFFKCQLFSLHLEVLYYPYLTLILENDLQYSKQTKSILPIKYKIQFLIL